MLSFLRRHIVLIAVAAGVLVLGTVGLSAFVYVYREAIAYRGIDALQKLLPSDPVAENAALLDSTFYVLRREVLEAPTDPGQGGAIAALGDEMFLITRFGALHRLDDAADQFVPVALDSPGEVTQSGDFYTRRKDYDALGYKDMMLRPSADDTVEIILSRARIDAAEPCVGLVIHRAVVPRTMLTDGGTPDWREIWQSTPCLDANPSFPYQAGGDMTVLPDGRLAVFVGDFGLDLQNRRLEGVGPQSPDDDYGKVIAIDPDTGAAERLSMGHRNPGGLWNDREGRLWAAEHGPEGGDELNLIEAGNNYGWPLESYGTHYGIRDWPPSDMQGRHDTFTRPIMAFVPSVAPSSLIQMGGTEFPIWRDDILMGSLKHRTLFRFHVREGRVTVAEPIPVGIRIRDIALDPQGRIYLKDDIEGVVQRLVNGTEAAPDAGTPEAVLAEAGCGGCHQIAADRGGEYAGPTLVGVMGRPVASVPDYAYSDGLMAKGGAWTRESLAAYLRDPEGWAPGTSMPASDLDDDGVAAVLDALSDADPS